MLLYVEMNSLEQLLQLMRRIRFCVEIVERVSVKENRGFLQHWARMLLVCKKEVQNVQEWMNSIDQELLEQVMQHPSTYELFSCGGLSKV